MLPNGSNFEIGQEPDLHDRSLHRRDAAIHHDPDELACRAEPAGEAGALRIAPTIALRNRPVALRHRALKLASHVDFTRTPPRKRGRTNYT